MEVWGVLHSQRIVQAASDEMHATVYSAEFPSDQHPSKPSEKQKQKRKSLAPHIPAGYERGRRRMSRSRPQPSPNELQVTQLSNDLPENGSLWRRTSQRSMRAAADE